jgi:hypothetical protein
MVFQLLDIVFCEMEKKRTDSKTREREEKREVQKDCLAYVT